jgi:hypothetical protein
VTETRCEGSCSTGTSTANRFTWYDVAQLIRGAFVGVSWLHEKRYLDQARNATGFNGPWPHVQDINSEEFREEN